jgi:hypothetical protein
MIEPDKKFHGGQRYYHRREVAKEDVKVNPNWEQRQEGFRREKRNRLWKIFVIGLGVIGTVVATWFLLTY